MRIEPAADPAVAVKQLADRFWEAVLEQAPTVATMYGDERWDDRLEDPGPEGRAVARALRQATLAELAAIPAEGLPTEERITADMLRVVCELGIAQDELRCDLVAGCVDQIDGPQARLPQVLQCQRAGGSVSGWPPTWPDFGRTPARSWRRSCGRKASSPRSRARSWRRS